MAEFFKEWRRKVGVMLGAGVRACDGVGEEQISTRWHRFLSGTNDCRCYIRIQLCHGFMLYVSLS